MEKLDGNKFSSAMIDFANKTLAVERIQDYLNNMAEYGSPELLNGQEQLTIIVDDLSKIFRRMEDAVRNLQDSVQTGFNSQNYWSTTENKPPIPVQCCHAQDLVHNNAFPLREVNMDEMCITGSTSPSDNEQVNLDEFLKTAKKNKENIPQMKWQYVASEKNSLTIYPSTKLGSCSQEANPIMSTWYKEGASPKPKNIVLVCDKSNSMNGQLMKYAKDALRAVLYTLVPNDR